MTTMYVKSDCEYALNQIARIVGMGVGIGVGQLDLDIQKGSPSYYRIVKHEANSADVSYPFGDQWLTSKEFWYACFMAIEAVKLHDVRQAEEYRSKFKSIPGLIRKQV